MHTPLIAKEEPAPNPGPLTAASSAEAVAGLRRAAQIAVSAERTRIAGESVS